MAVTIKSKTLTLTSLVKRLFPAEATIGGLMSLATQLQNAGYKLSTSPNKFFISIDSGKEMTVVSSVSLSFNAVKLSMKGQVGGSAKKAIKDKIIDLITKAAHVQAESGELPFDDDIYMTVEDAKPDVMKIMLETGNKIKAIKALRKATGLGLKESKDLVEQWIEDADAIAAHISAVDAGVEHEASYISVNATAVPLKDANALHQPVYGTSDGSRYHIIALNSDVRVAVRIYKNHHIALRAVCTQHHASKVYQKAANGFVVAGLVKKPNGHYSLHLEPDSFVMAKKTIGALLFAMGCDFTSISDRVGELVGVGK